MGKYSALKGTLDPAPVDSNWQFEVEKEKAGLPKEPDALGREYCKFRDEKDQLEAQIKKLNTKIEASQQELVAWLEENGMTQFRLQDGTSLSIKDDVYCSVEERDKFIAWIHETNQEELLTVHYQTMSGMAKERLSNGQPVPPGIKAFMKSSILRTKPRT